MSEQQIQNNSPSAMIEMAEVDAIIESIGRSEDKLIPLLQALQRRYNYLPQAALERICATTAITPEAAMGVATFYSQFRLKSAGRHIIKACTGTACHLKGAENVIDALKRHLEIPEHGDTSPDGEFTIERIACLGCCMLAPALQIDDVIYGHLSSQNAHRAVEDFIRAASSRGKEDVPDDAGSNGIGEARVCLCSSCRATGSDKIYDEAKRHAAMLRLPVSIKVVGCTGQSFHAPMLDIALSGGERFRYARLKPQDVRDCLLRHFQPGGGILRRVSARVTQALERVLTDETWEPLPRYQLDARSGPTDAFTGRQINIATEHYAAMNPLSLEDYEAHEGFAGLRKCLEQMSPEQVIQEVEQSGLRGRGGGGFPTGEKWRLVRQAQGGVKYIICNGDEGDPGAFMDRMLLESFPFRVIEGMAIAAYAAGATEGVLYVRAEYPLAIKRLREALRILEERDMIGGSVLGVGPPLNLWICEAAGAFVCGEETALMESIEGRRGMPRYRPPYPSASGLWGQPTLINNVETYAMIPWILRHGGAALAAIGTETSKGTKTFALAGKVKRGGLIEVPMGLTLREIIDDIGGGALDGKRIKAVQTGGPSGGCIPASMFDIPVDYEAIKATGAIMGSGGLVVLDEDDCMVDVARYFLEFTRSESCGKCTHCRVGTQRMHEILERLCNGQGKRQDIELLEHLCRITANGSLCGLGATAPNPVLTTLVHFREEYDAHVEGRCPAGKCKSLIRYEIDATCNGCTLCAQRCPVDAIPSRPYARHEIIESLCTRCDICRQTCPLGSVHIVTGQPEEDNKHPRNAEKAV
ncbi:NAD(P)H-dependent oxidoreductase subunit E [Candidatus Sumerlaeota bacterium]|nr:NAD(P)H-dependent oxidoreductase subunit E [Candidatus Sumerlaeota bacterium]